MPKLEPPVVSGADQMLALLSLVQDPAGTAARVQELRAAEADAAAAIAAVGTVREIPAIKAQAQQDAQQASEMLRQAKLDAAAMRQGALEEIAKAKDDVAAARREAAAIRKAIREQHTEWTVTVQAKDDELKAREMVVQKLELAAQKTAQAAEALKAEWEAKRDKLASAMAG